jgi:hypothetical protein
MGPYIPVKDFVALCKALVYTVCRSEDLKMSKHTPGPWQTGGRECFITEEKTGRAICMTDWHHDRPREENDANNSLIAAAPEMLEALYLLERILQATSRGDYREDCRMGKIIGDAIARAEGRKS